MLTGSQSPQCVRRPMVDVILLSGTCELARSRKLWEYVFAENNSVIVLKVCILHQFIGSSMH